MEFTEEQMVGWDDYEEDPEELAWDHAMDISASVYTRLNELGWTQKDLAAELGVSEGRVSQIIKGNPGMSLRLLARIECALGLDLGSGFSYRPSSEATSTQEVTRPDSGSGAWDGVSGRLDKTREPVACDVTERSLLAA